MGLFYRIGDPRRQPGIAGLVFPVTWSRQADPWELIHSGTVIVSGYVDDEGVAHWSEADMRRQIDQQREMIVSYYTPLTRVAPELAGTLNRVQRHPESAELPAYWDGKPRGAT